MIKYQAMGTDNTGHAIIIRFYADNVQRADHFIHDRYGSIDYWLVKGWPFFCHGADVVDVYNKNGKKR